MDLEPLQHVLVADDMREVLVLARLPCRYAMAFSMSSGATLLSLARSPRITTSVSFFNMLYAFLLSDE